MKKRDFTTTETPTDPDDESLFWSLLKASRLSDPLQLLIAVEEEDDVALGIYQQLHSH